MSTFESDRTEPIETDEVVHPEGNLDTVRCIDEYRQLLADDATFGSMTMEDLLAAKVLTQRTTAALRHRYIVR